MQYLVFALRLRQTDVKAEHFERKVATVETERDSWEQKYEVRVLRPHIRSLCKPGSTDDDTLHLYLTFAGGHGEVRSFEARARRGCRSDGGQCALAPFDFLKALTLYSSF